MKKIFVLVVLFAMVFQPGSGTLRPAAAQETQSLGNASLQTQGDSAGSGMPVWPVPEKPIPHHEPGQPARSASASYQTTTLNAQGESETFELHGMDALLADGTMTDPL